MMQRLVRCGIALLALHTSLAASARLPSPEPEQSVELRGRVTNAKGERVAATVRVFAAETLFEQLSRELDGGSPVPLATAMPDSRGLFTLRLETAAKFVRLEVRPAADETREILLPVRHSRVDVPQLSLYRRGAPETTRKSSVRVLDRERQPLAHAELLETSRQALFASGVPAWRRGPRHVTTSAEGMLQLATARRRLLGGSFFPNGAPAVTVQDALGSRTGPLRVRVVDENDRPVSGALALWSLGAPACGRTDERGELEITGVPAAHLIALTSEGGWGRIELPLRSSKPLEIRVKQDEGHDPTTARLIGPRASVDSLRLLPFARTSPALFWTVTAPEGREPQGRSLAGLERSDQALFLESTERTWSLEAAVVTVNAEGEERAIEHAVASTYRGWSYSGVDGKLRFDNLKGAARLRVDAPGFAAMLVDVTPQSDPLRIAMRPGGTGFGQVTDLQGQPISDALVALQVTDGPGSRDLSTNTDEAGGFEFRGLPNGVVELKVEARGFAPATIRGIEATNDGSFEIGTIALQPGARLRGVVLDERGDPLSGVAVHFATSPGLRRIGFSHTTYAHRDGVRPLAFHDARLETDAEGRFVLEDLLPDESFRLNLSKRGYLPLGVPIDLPVEDEIELRLETAATLLGSVTHDNGDPAERIEIVLQLEDAPDSAPQRRRSRKATTNPEGHYEFPSLAAGTYRLTARAPGLAVEIPEEPLSLSAGRTSRIDLTIGSGATVAGTVFHANRDPASSVRVRMAGQTDVTTTDGRYRLDGVRTGLQTFRATTGLGVQTEFDVEVLPGTNVVDAEFDGFLLTGQVLHADGRGAAGARVVGGRGALATADANGEFTLRGAARGKVRLMAGLGDQRANLEVDVPEQAENIVLTLEDRAAGSIRGTILGLDTDELAEVRLFATGKGYHQGPRPDFDGSFVFERLRPGEWSVQARLDSGNRMQSERVVVEADATSEVVLEFDERSAFLQVTVLENARPMPNVGLALESLETDGAPALATYGRSDYSGVARFEHLEPGRYRLAPTEAGGARYLWREIEVFGGESLTLNLRPARLGGSIKGPPGARVVLRLVHDSGQAFEEKLVVPGDYSFGVEVGSYQLEVTATAATPQSFPVQLTGESTRFDLSVGEGAPP